MTQQEFEERMLVSEERRLAKVAHGLSLFHTEKVLNDIALSLETLEKLEEQLPDENKDKG